MSIETGSKFYNIEEENQHIESSSSETDPELVRTLAAIARRVGGDFNISVKIGEPGEGSFFNPQESSITLDPLHVKENPELAKFVAGHEGAHRAITPGPIELGLSREQVAEHYSQIGFGYLHNIIEDPAVNDWLRQRFPGLERNVKDTYDEQLQQDNAILSTPEVQQIAMQLGFQPKFAQYGSEIIRDWHQKRYSKNLDPAVQKALDRTIKYARESITTIPDPEKGDKKQIITTAQERFRINDEYVWPEMKKLVEMDLHTEEQRQMLNDMFSKQQELQDKKEQLSQSGSSGNPEQQKQLQKDIDQLEKELKPFEQMTEEIKQEIKEKMEQALKEAMEQLREEIQKKQNQQRSSQEKQEDLNKQKQELQEKLESAEGKEKGEIQKQLQETQNQQKQEQAKQKEAEKDLKELQDIAKQLQDAKNNNPLPYDQLSEEAKQELEKLFKTLPKSDQQEYREQASESLEKFEDAINKKYEGQLSEDKPQNHEERRHKDQQQKNISEEQKKAERERKEVEKKLEQLRNEKKNEYDKAYDEVAKTVNNLYIRLKRFLLPESQPRWKTGFSTGARVDISKAMQAEADPQQLDKMWERKSIPHHLDYRFELLVDTSQSMTEGGKMSETFKALVAVTEVLEKLRIPYEIIGFSDQVRIFKNVDEKLTKEKRLEISTVREYRLNATHTDEAVQTALDQVAKKKTKNNFILTLTDGQPYPSEHGTELNKVLLQTKKDETIKTVRLGLESGTTDADKNFSTSIANMKMRVSDEEKRQGQKDFSESLADLLEDMIKHPEKY